MQRPSRWCLRRVAKVVSSWDEVVVGIVVSAPVNSDLREVDLLRHSVAEGRRGVTRVT